MLSGHPQPVDITLKIAQTNEDAIMMIIALLNLDAGHQYLLFHNNSHAYISERQTMGDAGVRDGVCS